LEISLLLVASFLLRFLKKNHVYITHKFLTTPAEIKVLLFRLDAQTLHLNFGEEAEVDTSTLVLVLPEVVADLRREH
jgi:hypothetical protein